MATVLDNLRQVLDGKPNSPPQSQPSAAPAAPVPVLPQSFNIASDDPLIAFFQNAPNVAEVSKLTLPSAALRAMKESGVRLAVPLVIQGELIGVLNLGPRLSEQDYSSDDVGLLDNLATQAAPAVRVAQLVFQQQLEAQRRERIEQELRVARLIQQTLLPKQLPALAGWNIAAHYQPARAGGGDFYDFIELSGGKLGLVIGDVTDKGVPAALVMATTRAILRGAAQRLASPGQVLERTNALLCDDIPPKMFVTCLYAILDPATGLLDYANAGHDLPYRRGSNGVSELRATGMPLGLMPGMTYEEKTVTLAPGESVLFYSDGLVEAHSPTREMFSFGRLQGLVGKHTGGAGLIRFLLDELAHFAGAEWEQEDDVTLMTLQRANDASVLKSEAWRKLTEFTVASEPGNERAAMKQVAASVAELGLPAARLEKLKTAVAEATMNAIEHGNQNRVELLVTVEVSATASALAVRITDKGGGGKIPAAATPDIEAKLAGEQSPRGWGLFLIKNLVDEVNTVMDGTQHTVELIMKLKGAQNG